MGKIRDALQGLYFRKSKQLELSAALARIESTQSACAQAIMQAESNQGAAERGMEQLRVAQAAAADALARIESSQTITEAMSNLASGQRASEERIARLHADVASFAQRTDALQSAAAPAAAEEMMRSAISNRGGTLSDDLSDEAGDAYRRWYDGLEFSSDWTSSNFGVWARVFNAHGASFREALEIGSYEGRSAIFFLEYLPRIHLICVDKFDYAGKGPVPAEVTGGERFDRNLRKYGDRFEKIVSSSASALSNFVSIGKHFDLIYIDGSHRRDDVLVDALLSWRLLNVNGVIIFDDYLWRQDLNSEARPKEAIEYFVYSHLNEMQILHIGWQFIVKKTI